MEPIIRILEIGGAMRCLMAFVLFIVPELCHSRSLELSTHTRDPSVLEDSGFNFRIFPSGSKLKPNSDFLSLSYVFASGTEVGTSLLGWVAGSNGFISQQLIRGKSHSLKVRVEAAQSNLNPEVFSDSARGTWGGAAIAYSYLMTPNWLVGINTSGGISQNDLSATEAMESNVILDEAVDRPGLFSAPEQQRIKELNESHQELLYEGNTSNIPSWTIEIETSWAFAKDYQIALGINRTQYIPGTLRMTDDWTPALESRMEEYTDPQVEESGLSSGDQKLVSRANFLARPTYFDGAGLTLHANNFWFLDNLQFGINYVPDLELVTALFDVVF